MARIKLADYQERFRTIRIERDADGILVAALHTNGGSITWGVKPHYELTTFWDIAGQDRANPISQMLCAAQMLEHIGETRGAELVRRAIVESLGEGRLTIERTMQPSGGTRSAGRVIAETMRALEL